jgi:mono/diheme cytochrome c family protein
MKSNVLIQTAIMLTLAPFGATAGGSSAIGWTEVSAIFTERCVMCHSSVAGASKGLQLDNYSAALIGSERGAVLVPGDVDGSELVRRLRGESKPRMPFLSRPLPDNQIDLIESWVAAGLPENGVVD